MPATRPSPLRTASFIASIPARFYAFYMGFIFLFGQLFAGRLSIAATTAGVCGLAAAVLPVFANERAKRTAALVCFMSVAGVAGDAYEYYAHLAIPGNYYAWFLIGPFAAATAFLGARHVASFGPGRQPAGF